MYKFNAQCGYWLNEPVMVLNTRITIKLLGVPPIFHRL